MKLPLERFSRRYRPWAPLFSAVVGASFAAACDHEASAPPATAAMTSSGIVAAQPVSSPAGENITRARCDREDRCANIGAGRKYATREVCTEQIRSDNMNALTNGACPAGIDPGHLQTCIDDARGERCDHPFDTLDRIASCRRQYLCPR